ncbi:MAG: ADP-ribosylglycohydrolase family protein [Lachnospiraceae bacterium]|nr:ADP-ribosylglycohydrolase family protein [Lachnospiraceae bacterium]
MKREDYLDAIRGCIFGGAAGDALGYPVEFFGEEEIFNLYGPEGISRYELDPASGKAHISDDTQMSLFTANGLLVGDTRRKMRGVMGNPRAYVAMAYLDWLKTQELSFEEVNRHERFSEEGGYSWLLDVPELFSRRAPGTTCLSALMKENSGETFDDYVEAKRNSSKGCGGIMRVAPIAVDYKPGREIPDIEMLDMEGAELAAVTHGHSLGYMPAAVLVHIINRIVFPEGERLPLKEIVLEARDTAAKIFAGDPNLPELVGIIDLAVDLSENGSEDDLDNIHKLGQGWVAEETLGIAIYCALRHQDDFSEGLRAAVNHRGDSDSTGAVTGNILGALLGYEAIEDKWKKDLEISEVILEIADDLCMGCRMSARSSYYDPDWEIKYMYMHRPVKQSPFVFFWKESEENGCFSNWFRRKFTIDDFEYLHVEQYMMAQKARLFHDPAIYTAILKAEEPWECKELGKKVANFDEDTWAAARYDIVKEGNRAKFEQNPDLMKKLLYTGTAILAEASPKKQDLGDRPGR